MTATLDVQRLNIMRSEPGIKYLTRAYRVAKRTKGTALGTDHPALVLHKYAERRANAAACEKLTHSIDETDLYREAQEQQASEQWDAARETLRKAKQLRSFDSALQSEYEKRAAHHLHTMRRAVAAGVSLEKLDEAHTEVLTLTECTPVVDTQRSDDTPSAPSAKGLELAAHLSANAPGLSCSTYAADPYPPDETEGGA
jgi:hypothetical protein